MIVTNQRIRPTSIAIDIGMPRRVDLLTRDGFLHRFAQPPLGYLFIGEVFILGEVR